MLDDISPGFLFAPCQEGAGWVVQQTGVIHLRTAGKEAKVELLKLSLRGPLQKSRNRACTGGAQEMSCRRCCCPGDAFFFWFASQMEQSVTTAPELETPSSGSLKIRMETCHTCSVEEPLKSPSTERERETKEKHLSPEPVPAPGQADRTEGTSRDATTGGSSCQEFLKLSPGKEVMKEMSRVKREVCFVPWSNFCLWRGI